MSLRAKKKDATRDALVREAVARFARDGYEATAVREIAEAAGVTERTFFRYFETKEDVVFHDVDRYLAAFREVLSSPEKGESGFRRIRRAASTAAELMEAAADTLLPRLRLVAAVSALQARDLRNDLEWMSAIAAADSADRGADPSSDLRALLVAGATMGALKAALAVWISRGGTPRAAQLVQEAFDLLEQGLG